VQFRTIQRADLLVAITTPPAVIMAVINDRLTILLIAAAAVAAIRAVFVRTVVVALKAGQAQPMHHRQPVHRRHLALVHDLAERRESREMAALGIRDLY
jgi:hypothetical protein